ncbi:hypothetical protein XALC_1248 [Xanthomonas albilineans GPE PC73]|uniref:Uncharacterized protein n=1 Tax=Xanthomonas albilineans (strain GPE PC73 / CFBP 7063) TaxID=380358 RepID=D2UA28_XANAP|nr:hypothetical protein XALC_1248 [Xanthomonas albilineans GPE PC73]
MRVAMNGPPGCDSYGFTPVDAAVPAFKANTVHSMIVRKFRNPENIFIAISYGWLKGVAV